MESAGGGDAAKIQKQQAQRESDLFNLGYPGFRIALSDLISDLGQPGQEPDSVKKAFKELRNLQGREFDKSERSIPGAVEYQNLTSGGGRDFHLTDSVNKEALFTLESRRRAQAQLLNQQETDVAMQTRDFEMSQITGLSGQALSSGRGFTQNALAAAGYRTGNPWGGALSGAASGAAAGSAVAPGWGTLIGGLAGGIGGYFSGGG